MIAENRYAVLDSLRGLAAAVVVLRHFINIWPYDDMGVFFFLFLRSPLRALFAAHEAVLLFFLISGFVLTLPLLRGRVPYPAFLTRRVSRIYLPYLVALAGAWIGATYLSGRSDGLSDWFNLTWFRQPTQKVVLDHLVFVGRYPNGEMNTAFWSLVYEMRISLVFPIVAIIVLWLSPLVGLAIVLTVSVLVMMPGPSPYEGDWLITVHYAGIFVVGGLMAKHLGQLRSFHDRLTSLSRWLLWLPSVVLILYGAGPRGHLGDLTDWFIVAGLVWLTVSCLCNERLQQLLLSPLPSFLGKISYSLYLVHGTVLFALVHLAFGRIPLLGVFPLYVGLSLVIAVLMHRYVEKPTMTLGRKLAGYLS